MTIRDKTRKESQAFINELRAKGFRANVRHTVMMAWEPDGAAWTMFTAYYHESSMASVNKNVRQKDSDE